MYASNDERRYRETVNILKIYFILFMSFLHCRYITLVMDQGTLEVFLELISVETTLGI